MEIIVTCINQLINRSSDHSDDQQPMEMDFCGPSLAPWFG